MAKIKTSALVADIKGTVGGNVFASNKGGNYVRRYKKPINRNTEAQQAVRALFGANSGGWRLLTDTERESWITGAINFPYVDSLGEPRVYSGQQLFNSLNNNLIQIGEETLNTCPVPQSFPSTLFKSAIIDVTTPDYSVEVQFDGSQLVPMGFSFVLGATGSLSAGISAPQKGRFKKLTNFGGGTSIIAQNFEGFYTPIFGALVGGDSLFLSGFLINLISGEAATMQMFKTVAIEV